MPDPTFNLDKTLGICAAASGGPWASTWSGTQPTGPASLRVVDGPQYAEPYSNHELDFADAEFIAHARTVLPAYAAALKQILTAHAPRDIYEDDDALQLVDHEFGLAGTKLATVCRTCCCDRAGDQTAECAAEHAAEHAADVDGYHCATARLAAGVRP